MAKSLLPDAVKSLLRDMRVQAAFALLAVFGLAALWDRTTYPPPGPALAPQIVAHMADNEWRVMGPGGERRILPQQGMTWGGRFDCERFHRRRRSVSKVPSSRPAPTFQCIIEVVEPTGLSYPVVLRLTYATARSDRISVQLFGYARPPDIPPFYLYPAPWDEAITALSAAGLWPL